MPHQLKRKFGPYKNRDMAKPKKKRFERSSSKALTPPKDFTPGFLADMDARTAVFRALRTAQRAIIDDCGGEANLTHVKRAMIDRFIFLEALMQNIEARIVTTPEAADDLIGKYLMSNNSLQGLGRLIGLKRELKRVGDLSDYIDAAREE